MAKSWQLNPLRQLSGHVVAREKRHRDTPNFCVRIISDIYHVYLGLLVLYSGVLVLGII